MVILLAFVLTITLFACNGEDEIEDFVIVRVGDKEISQSQLDQYTYLYSFLQGIDLSSSTEEEMDYIQSMVLEDYISLKVMETYYKDDDNVLPDGYQEEIDTFIEQVSDDETASAYMEQYGITDEFLEEFYISQYYSAAFFEEIQPELREVSDEEIQEYYNENQSQFEVDEITAKHILVEEKDLAEDILSQLEDGADFGEMAAEYGTDGTADKGGDLGTFGRNAMIPDFEEPAFALDVGELSDIVETDYGYHIILVTDKNQGIEAFEDVEDVIRSSLENNVIVEKYTEKITELREEYGVEYVE